MRRITRGFGLLCDGPAPALTEPLVTPFVTTHRTNAPLARPKFRASNFFFLSSPPTMPLRHIANSWRRRTAFVRFRFRLWFVTIAQLQSTGEQAPGA